MNKLVYIGIDVGKDGGFSIIYENGIVCEVWDDDLFLEATSDEKLNCIACVEQVGAMPQQGVKSMFNFGKSAGFIEGVLRARTIPYQLVRPQEWKKEFGLNSDKQKSIEVCRKLFPNVDLKATAASKKFHDGKAESLLIAEYARRKFRW